MEPYLPKKILWRRKKMGFTFPYKRYFTLHADVFEPQWNWFRNRGVLKDQLGSYQYFLERDPVKLWRTLSTAIWSANRDKVDP